MDWEIEVEVTFSYREWQEPRPYGSTVAYEQLSKLIVHDVKALDGRPFDEYPERHEIVRDGFISQLEEDDSFYEAVINHLNR